MSNRVFFPQKGACPCGEVQFHLLKKPMFIHCCHCSWCQKETGSAFAINALIEADQVTLLKGETETIHTPSASGKGQNIVRCKNCKVAVWSNYSGAGDVIHFVRVGTLNNPSLFAPNIHIYTSTKQPWIQLLADVPSVDEYYRRSEYWPQASIDRYKKARGQ